MAAIIYTILGTIFLYTYCSDGKNTKNWHFVVELLLFGPLVIIWLVAEFVRWAWSNLLPWLNEEI